MCGERLHCTVIALERGESHSHKSIHYVPDTNINRKVCTIIPLIIIIIIGKPGISFALPSDFKNFQLNHGRLILPSPPSLL